MPTPSRSRKPFRKRTLRNTSTSDRFKVGTRKNKRNHTVGTFASDRRTP